MSDVLAGMTRKEAEALVARCEAVQHDAIEWEDGSVTSAVKVICEAPEDVDALLALAALGARCVGAKEMWVACEDDWTGVALWDTKEEAEAPCAKHDTPFGSRRVLVLEGE